MFTLLSKIGKSFMTPIALLPAAGILLGLGGSFTSSSMIEANNLQAILGDGTILNMILMIMKNAGDIVFKNLPVLFAVGVSVGLANREKGTAALAGIISFLVMHAVIATLISITHMTADSLVLSGQIETKQAAEELFSDVLGINHTLQMGVFGGIISGLLTVWLHNRYYNVQLPEVLGFFGGARFVPIVASFSAIFLGVLLFYIWPYIGIFLGKLSGFILGLGEWGSFLHGMIERALIPFGLHHIYYMPLWQTSLGGTEIINGLPISGTQNEFFAHLKDGTLAAFSSTNFMSGKFPFMIFGLPGAALAMYRCAKPENRSKVFGLLFGAAITAMLTGITEPLEFTFLFLAPVLYYAVHVPLAGLSFYLMDLLQVKVGMTFSGGLIDLSLFGIVPSISGQQTNWIYIIIVGIPYFFVYYFIFSYFIKKKNLMTPGRGDDEDFSLKTRKDYDAQNSSADIKAKSEDQFIVDMIASLGGAENILGVEACITRLRITLKDASKVVDDETWKKEFEARGVVHVGDNGLQLIYGAKAAQYQTKLHELLNFE